MSRIRKSLLPLFFLFLSCREPAGDQPKPSSSSTAPVVAANEDQFFVPRPEEGQRRRKPDRDESSVRLKLRRDSKDGYTWELSGDDLKEVLKMDKQLRRELLSKQEGENRSP
jgi:hypothetical protein